MTKVETDKEDNIRIMKLIFLDIDGVLNYQLMWEEKRQCKRYEELLKGAPDGAHDICEKKVELLNELIKKTEAKVVMKIYRWYDYSRKRMYFS